LQAELVQRCRAHPRYSLRAFARFLEIDHSTLSQILRGKRKLSSTQQARFAERLGLGPLEVPGLPAQELSHDAFQVIADWYHYAIFELVTLKDFRPNARWIARRLGLTASEVSIAVERLFRLGLLRRGTNGQWKQGSPLITTTGNSFSTLAFRRLQTQVLRAALDAMETVPLEARDQSSMTMAISSARLEEAKDRIKRFRRSFCAWLQQDSERDAVYQIGISFYPVTLSNSEGEKR
jgi:uncharacterized protein (TIGR02147 family)